MKITIYTIKDCAFSKQEKVYLNTNKLVFEEKDLETNKEFLTEMLAISNNFAGTPVTRIEKDDGTISVLKGFTKEEFDTTLGFTAAPTMGSGNPTPTTDSTVPTPVNDTPIPPVVEITPTEPGSSSTIPTDLSEPSADLTDSADSTVTPDPLKSVMDDLQAKSEPATPPAPTTPVVNEPVQPTSPDEILTKTGPTDSTVSPTDAPAIPDFPVK